MEFNIGDRVRVRQYDEIPEELRHKGFAKNVGKEGEIVDILYSTVQDCYMYRIHFDGKTKHSKTDFPEGSFDLIEDTIEEAAYAYEFDYLDNVVVARLYQIDGDKKTEIGRGHGHIIHGGAFGVAQAASYALKRIAIGLGGGCLDPRLKEGEK